MDQTYQSSIKRKVMAVILLASVVVSLLTVIAFVVCDVVTFKQTLVRNVLSQGRLIAENSAGALAFSDQADAENALASLRSEPHLVAAALYDKQGHLFAKFPANAPDSSFPPKPEKWAYQFQNHSLCIFQPVVRSGATLGTVFLQSNLQGLTERLRRYAEISFIILVLALLVAVILSNMLQRRISTPIVALAKIARAISEQQDYTIRASRVSNDELGLLTDSFNTMLERIYKTEIEMRQARDEAVAASHAKDDFLAALSHELRTPLNPVLLIASDAAANLELPAAIRKDFETIGKNVELEARLIDDLLDLTRVARGRVQLNLRKIKVNDLLQEVIAHFQAELDGKQIELSRDLRANPDVIEGDPVRLQQILWNVLKNAAKFTPEKGKVSVITQTADNTLKVEIMDTGIGITPNELKRVFDPFSQGDHAAENAHRVAPWQNLRIQ